MTKCSAHPVHIDLQQKSLIPTSSCILTRVHIWCFPFTLAFILCWFTSSSVCYHLIDVAVSGYLICSSSFLLSCKVSALIQFCFDLRKSSSVDCLCQTIAGLAYAGFLLLLVLLIFPLYLISILPFFSAKPLLCLTSPLRFVLYCTLRFFLTLSKRALRECNKLIQKMEPQKTIEIKTRFLASAVYFVCYCRVLGRLLSCRNIESMGTFKKNFIMFST